MLRRALRIVRVVTLMVFATLALLAAAAWVNVAGTDKGREFEVRWGGADGHRFRSYIYDFACESIEGVFLAHFIDYEAPAIEEPWSWQPRDTWPILDYLDRKDEWCLEFEHGEVPSSFRDASVAAPLWAPMLLFGLWPSVTGLRLARRRLRLKRRRKLGLCLACGYDLRGLESARCPECGVTIFERKAAGG